MFFVLVVTYVLINYTSNTEHGLVLKVFSRKSREKYLIAFFPAMEGQTNDEDKGH